LKECRYVISIRVLAITEGDDARAPGAKLVAWNDSALGPCRSLANAMDAASSAEAAAINAISNTEGQS
jgi:hypothetical protein